MVRRRQSLLGGLGDTRALCSTERSTMRTPPGKTATVITRELPAGSGGTTGAASSPPLPRPPWRAFSSAAVGADTSCVVAGTGGQGKVSTPATAATANLTASRSGNSNGESWFPTGEEDLIFK